MMMERHEARVISINLLERYAARLIADIDAYLAAENRLRAGDAHSPTTNTPARYRRFYERCLARYLADLNALPQEGMLHPMAVASWRFYAEASEAWLASDSDDHEGRSMWFDVFAEYASETLSPKYDPGEAWEERLVSIKGYGVGTGAGDLLP